jgi:CheY-like chemotaxis protein
VVHSMGHEPPFILCAEDDDGTGVLLERDLTHVDPTTSPQRLHDAQEAMDFVRCDGTYANRYITKPIVLLLNVNIPRVDGVETLRQLKSDSRTACVPIIWLTKCGNPSDIRRCYELRRDAFIAKPGGLCRLHRSHQSTGLFPGNRPASCFRRIIRSRLHDRFRPNLSNPWLSRHRGCSWS